MKIGDEANEKMYERIDGDIVIDGKIVDPESTNGAWILGRIDYYERMNKLCNIVILGSIVCSLIGLLWVLL